MEPFYESLLQVIYGANTIALLFWLSQRTTHGFLRSFALVSWFEALWFVGIALSREEWRVLWFAAGGFIKALLFPYLSRRWPDSESKLQPMRPGPLVFVFVLLAVFAMFLGRAAGPLYRLNGEALGVVFLVCLSALFSIAARATSRLQLLSLAVLEGGLVLFGAHINTQIPMSWIVASIVLLIALFWRITARADTAVVEA